MMQLFYPYCTIRCGGCQRLPILADLVGCSSYSFLFRAYCSPDVNKESTSDNRLQMSSAQFRARSKSRHRHGAVKSSTSSPTSSPGHTQRGTSAAGKSGLRHTVSSSNESNIFASTLSSVLRSRNYDSDNQNDAATVCKELRIVQNTVRSSETGKRHCGNYDSDDNGNNRAPADDVINSSPSMSVRCKPRRFKRVLSAGQSLEKLSSNKIQDDSLQDKTNHIRSDREVKIISLLFIIGSVLFSQFFLHFMLNTTIDCSFCNYLTFL